MYSLLFSGSQLISGGMKLLHPVAALVSTVLQLLLQGANGRVHTQPLRLDPCVRLQQETERYFTMFSLMANVPLYI